ncbi:MAG TPA: aminotransferase class I/II-fold pyridoxal phosphate-dependent enzyme [Anaerolineales bacterium]|nr:aminotransferase class I/II-fold pyridoxal phosphate-dependent enzyme [Anaerolineales bacterium]
MVKTSISDLAHFGGSPMFEEPLHVGRPNIGDREKLLERFNDVLERRWLTNGGPCVQELERRIETLLGVRHCIAMCNATIALEIASRALGFQGEVIIPSFTFIATAHALQWQEITPVFCDIDPRTHNLDPRQVEALITPRTTGILGVHVWGRACAVEELEEIASRHNLRLMYDAAHAFGCSHNGKMIGGFGEAEVFSFHATKFFNTLEGGAVVTNNDELASRIRFMTNFGFKYYDTVEYLGTNGKMNEISAAMGLTGLEHLDQFIEVNRHHYRAYRSLLSGLPGVKMIGFNEAEQNNYQYVVLEIDEAQAGISRDLLNDILHAEKVLSRRYFYPGCHQMEPYASSYPEAGSRLPETEKLTLKVLQLPTGTAVGQEEIERVCELIHFVFANAQEVQDRAAKRQQMEIPRL